MRKPGKKSHLSASCDNPDKSLQQLEADRVCLVRRKWQANRFEVIIATLETVLVVDTRCPTAPLLEWRHYHSAAVPLSNPSFTEGITFLHVRFCLRLRMISFLSKKVIRSCRRV